MKKSKRQIEMLVYRAKQIAEQLRGILSLINKSEQNGYDAVVQ